MNRTSLLLAALCLLLTGALLGSTLSVPEAHANTTWACYRVNEFPDAEKAAGWKAARSVSEGLNTVAGHAPSGTVVPTKWDKGDADLLCVKQ
ncbi:MAG: hypothetical protein KDA24_03195 [Deltaproteobacteria bacterium]|nr:hypothetical protein [Deltaproteobacteria bacterium]